jgi:hypothetical protein
LNEKAHEQAWARGAQTGSAEDFAQLVRLHQQALRAFLRRLCGNHADADDLAQETFVSPGSISGGSIRHGGFDPGCSALPGANIAKEGVGCSGCSGASRPWKVKPSVFPTPV